MSSHGEGVVTVTMSGGRGLRWHGCEAGALSYTHICI